MDARFHLPNHSPTPQRTRANLRRSLVDVSGYAVMVGVGEFYIPAFVLALSLGEIASGLVATLPPVLGAAAQLLTARGVRWLRSHKAWVLLTVGAQALSFLPLIAGAIIGAMPAWAVFLAASAYWSAGLAAGSAWSTLIATLVPRSIRAAWFGQRQRIYQLGTLAGFLLGGVILAAAAGGAADPDRSRLMLAFIILFSIAALARGMSWVLLKRHDEPQPMPRGHRPVAWHELWRRLHARGESGRDARLIAYMLLVSFAAHFAAPYITPYILGRLQSGYVPYAILIGTVMFVKVFTLAACGRFAARHGAHRLLLIGGFGMAPVGIMWTLSLWTGPFTYAWLIIVQLYSGVVWGCYELAVWLLLLDHLKEQERTSLVSWQLFFERCAIAVGSLAGGWVLHASDGPDGSPTVAAYALVFAISAVLRISTFPLLLIVARRPAAETPSPPAVRAAVSAIVVEEHAPQ